MLINGDDIGENDSDIGDNRDDIGDNGNNIGDNDDNISDNGNNIGDGILAVLLVSLQVPVHGSLPPVCIEVCSATFNFTLFRCNL